jgi:hypothetical protein
MRRAISYVNSGKFRVKTEAEQQIWNECSRLWVLKKSVRIS